MGAIKRHLYNIEEEKNSSGLTDMEEYELYISLQKLKQNMKTEEEVMEYFQALMGEGGN